MMTFLTEFGRNAERHKAVTHRLGDLALALLGHRLVVAGVDNDGAGRTDDRPDEKVERLQYVVRIAADEIDRRAARMMAVFDRVNLVDVFGRVISWAMFSSAMFPPFDRKDYARTRGREKGPQRRRALPTSVLTPVIQQSYRLSRVRALGEGEDQ